MRDRVDHMAYNTNFDHPGFGLQPLYTKSRPKTVGNLLRKKEQPYDLIAQILNHAERQI